MQDAYAPKQNLLLAAVPTNDTQVRTELRKLGEPISLFGNGHAGRRAGLIAPRSDQNE
jgi:hypothetical protein